MEIMSAPTFSFARTSACLIVLGLSPGLFAAEITLQKVPPLTVEQSPAYPENLARYHLGAQVEAAPRSNPITKLQLSSKSEDHNSAEAALLCDDPTVGYVLQSGVTTLLVSLPKIENIDNVSFLNDAAKGDVNIATSSAKLAADSPQWHNVTQQDLSAESVKVKIGPNEAKYVKLTFNVTEPGRIAGFGVYSTPAISDFTMPRPRKSAQDHSSSFALISYNFTDLHAKARALYVSSGSNLKEANNMIDDQPSTAYNFSANDAAPTAIVDLGKVCTLRRLSAIFSPRKGSIDFYLLPSVPGFGKDNTARVNASGLQTTGEPAKKMSPAPENFPPALTLHDDTLAELKPVGTVTTEDAQGRASVDFAPTSGRYVMVKWNPAEQENASFAVAEIAAFGESKQSSTLVAANVGHASSISTDDKETIDAKDRTEGKDKEMPGEGPQAPAEGPPPNLPDPPPFVLIPEIVPTSP
jgi:hypothetical protein